MEQQMMSEATRSTHHMFTLRPVERPAAMHQQVGVPPAFDMFYWNQARHGA